ncbi:MAG: hypothetical protein J6X62_05410 [Bacteroidales bacterium]|nr:hypothetical protein [Bacteroidales bacterium]
MKKNRNTLFDNMMLTVDNTAILTLQTTARHYDTADLLNNIYHLAMHRGSDMSVCQSVGQEQVQCPFFYSEDPVRHQLYMLIDIRSAAHLVKNLHVTCNMLFVVNGDDAWAFVDKVADELTNQLPAPMEDDYWEQQRHKLLDELRSSLMTCQVVDVREDSNALDDELMVVKKPGGQEPQLEADEAAQQPALMQMSLFGEPTMVAATKKPAAERSTASKSGKDRRLRLEDVDALLQYIETYFAPKDDM